MPFDLENYWYVPLDPDEKRPVRGWTWGGWPLDTGSQEIVDYGETQNSKHDAWAIVGNKQRDLIVIDVDSYEMDETEKERVLNSDWSSLLDITTVVKSQKGGYHVYFRYEGDDIEHLTAIDSVDIKGQIPGGRGYVKSPEVDGYELTNDKAPLTIDQETLESFPVWKYNDATPDIDEYLTPSFVRSFPPCIKNALREEPEGWEDLVDLYLFHDKPQTNATVYRVLDRSEYPPETRMQFPPWWSDQSESGTRFMIDEGGDTWRCWKHDTGNVLHMIGIKHGLIECATPWRSIERDTWQEIFDIAKKKYAITTKGRQLTCHSIKEEGLCPYDCGRVSPYEQ